MTVLTNAYLQNWTCTSDPSPTCSLSMGGTIYVGDTITNLTTGDRFTIISFTYDSINDIYNDCVWQKIITDYNLLTSLADVGIEPPSSQAYTNVSLSFSTSRTPHSTKNTFVIATISQSSVLLGSATANALVGGSQIASVGVGGVVETQTNTLSFMVGPTDSYELTQSTTGVGSSNTIISVKEYYL